MKIDNRVLGQMLLDHLNKDFNIVSISRWAYELFSDNCRWLSPDVEEVLQYLFRMEDDPQFEYTEQELKLLATKLINNEKEAIKQINNIKLKRVV